MSREIIIDRNTFYLWFKDKNKKTDGIFSFKLKFDFFTGYVQEIVVTVTIEDKLCRVKTLKLSEKFVFLEYNVRDSMLIPEILTLPSITQEPDCGYDLNNFIVARIEGSVPIKSIREAVHIDN